jgi:hypothetical protein
MALQHSLKTGFEAEIRCKYQHEAAKGRGDGGEGDGGEARPKGKEQTHGQFGEAQPGGDKCLKK